MFIEVIMVMNQSNFNQTYYNNNIDNAAIQDIVCKLREMCNIIDCITFYYNQDNRKKDVNLH